MVKKAFQDSNLIEIKGNPTASVATIGELKEVFAGETGDVNVTVDDIQDASDVGKSLLTSSTAAEARTSIGAGTSNLSIGTTAGTAMAGNTALLKVGTTATQAAAGNHTHAASAVSITSMFDGDTSTNVQEALLLLAQKIAALENPAL